MEVQTRLMEVQTRLDHDLGCGVGSEMISRHNALRDAFFDTAVSAGLGATKEGRFLMSLEVSGRSWPGCSVGGHGGSLGCHGR